MSIFFLLTAFVAFYLAGIAVIGTRDVRPSPAKAIVSIAIGASTTTLLFLLTKFIGVSEVATAAILPATFTTLMLRRPEIRPHLAAPEWTGIVAVALCLVYVAPTLIMGLRMGYGDYPAMFFAADTPYFLQQVHSLSRSHSYPPPSLEVWNFAYPYQYGMQSFVSLLEKFTGMKAHTLMFAVIMPLVEFSIAVIAFDICRRICKAQGMAIIALLVFLFGYRQYYPGHLLDDFWTFLTSVERFGFRYPSITSSAGMLILLSILRCLLDFDSPRMRRAAVWLVGLMPLFKLPYVVAAGSGLALIYSIQYMRKRDPALIIELAVAACLAGLSILVFFQGETVHRYLLAMDFLGFMAMTRTYQHETFAVLLTILLAIRFTTRASPWPAKARELLLFSVAPLLLFLPISYRALNDFQIFDPLLHLSALLCGNLIALTWLNKNHSGIAGLLAGTITSFFLVIPGLISSVNHSVIVATTPERGHEFTDNRLVADALLHIPVANTLTITNDLRYPANNFRRNNRQFQLAGIFGHQNFASNLVYGGDRLVNRPVYEAAINLFRRATWPADEISAFISVVPVTHLLIHKEFQHAKDIPLELIYSNERYAVYRF